MFDFYIEHEELINYSLFYIFFIFLSCFLIYYFDTQLSRELDIIENTKNYFVFSDCKKFDGKYYCWNSNY